MTSRTNKAKKGLISSLFQYGVLVILQLLLIPLILKESGQEVLGSYTIIMQIIGYCLIFDLGVSTSISRYLSQSFDADNISTKFSRVFNIGRILVFLTNLIASLFIIFISFNLEKYFSISPLLLLEVKMSIWVLALWILLRSPLLIYSHALYASQNMSSVNIITAVGIVIRFSMSIIFIYAGAGLLGLIFSFILNEVINLFLQRSKFKVLYPSINLKWSKPEVALTKEILKFGFKYWGINLATLLSVGSDTLIVGHLYGATAASIYYTTKIPSFLITQLIYKISANASSAANELFSQSKFEILRVAYLKLVRYTLLIGIPVAVGIIGFNEAVINTWVGSNQYAGMIMTLSLSVFLLTQIINHVNAMIVVVYGNLQSWAMISIVCSVFTALLGYIFGKIYGLQWVMLIIAAGDVPIFIFLLFRCLCNLRLSFLEFYNAGVKPAFLVSLPLFLLVIISIFMDFDKNYSNLFIGFVIYSIVWFIGLYYFGLNSQEKHLVRYFIKNYLS